MAIYKEVTGMIVFCPVGEARHRVSHWPSQTFRLPFSGWLTLDILLYSRGPPRVFILAHLSLRNRRVIRGNLEPQGDLFFLFLVHQGSSLREGLRC